MIPGTLSPCLRIGLGALALCLLPVLHSGAEEVDRIRAGGATITVVFDSAPSPPLRTLALGWITKAANAVTVYYQRYPVRQVEIDIHVDEGVGVNSGRAFGYPKLRIRLSMGRDTKPGDITEDTNGWMMTHEMVHLALSSVEEQHHWLEEGLATYVEPIARVRAGELSSRQVWRDMVEHMPQGQPVAGDQGLDNTPTWGRTYWGGAIFCLLADVEIHKQTGNRKGLEDALRGIINSGGTLDTEWGIARVLATGDKAIGKNVLQPLYEQMKDRSTPVDLDSLWRDLGVEVRDGKTTFDDAAPLADIRKAIMPDSPGAPKR